MMTRAKPKRGDVWRTDLEPTRGDEMRKTRPAVVVSDNRIGKLELCIIVPITDWKERYAQAPWMVYLDPSPDSGLTKPSAGDAFQVRSVSHQRLVERLGYLPEATLDEIADAIALCVAYRSR